MASKQDRLLSFYRQVLASVDLPADEEGRIFYQAAGDEERTPAAVDGKDWILPTREALGTRNIWEDHIAFHPLSENFLNGESPVLGKFKAAINLRLGAVAAELMGWLVKFAAEPELQASGNVSAKASKYLKLVPNIKKITSERFEEILDRSAGSSDRRFVNLYLKRGGDILDSRYQWACIATFPFRQELEGEQPKIFGVTISKKDQQSFKDLFDYMLPDNEDIATYSAGSMIKSACKFDATLRSFAKIAERLNEIIHIHKKVIPPVNAKNLLIDLEWMSELDSLDKLADVVPPLPGNEGESARERRTEGAAVSAKPAVSASKGKRAFGGGSGAPAVDKPAQRQTTAVVEVDEEEEVEVVRQPRKRDDEPHPTESFAERMNKFKRHQPAPVYGQPGYVTPYRGAQSDYSNTAGERVPEWARNEGTTMVVVGQEQPQYQDPRFRQERPTSSFGERMAHSQGARGPSMYRGGGHGGGNFQL